MSIINFQTYFKNGVFLKNFRNEIFLKNSIVKLIILIEKDFFT